MWLLWGFFQGNSLLSYKRKLKSQIKEIAEEEGKNTRLLETEKKAKEEAENKAKLEAEKKAKEKVE